MGDFYAEAMEPASESCMKIQRNAGDNGKRSKIRVVTPQPGPYSRGMAAFFMHTGVPGEYVSGS